MEKSLVTTFTAPWDAVRGIMHKPWLNSIYDIEAYKLPLGARVAGAGHRLGDTRLNFSYINFTHN